MYIYIYTNIHTMLVTTCSGHCQRLYIHLIDVLSGALRYCQSCADVWLIDLAREIPAC